MIKQGICASFVAAALVLVAAPVLAQTKDVYEVRNITVDITADTASKAREQALADGQTRAFQKLLERLTLRIEHGGLPKLTSDEIAPFVSDFSVEGEKTSAVRYLATLTFRFKNKEVRKLLNDFGFSFAETVSKPVLVLPVFQNAGALILWDDPNPWRDAWAGREKRLGLVPTLMPLGDLKDIGAIGAEQAMDGDQQRLNAIAKRYGASDTLVVFGVLRLDAAKGRRVLDVYFTRHGSHLREQTEVVGFTQNKDETVEILLARAARELTYIVEDNWKRDNILQFERSGEISAVVPITGLKDWLEVKSRLGNVAVIRSTDMVLMSQTEVRITLHFLGETAQLTLALEQADLKLNNEGGIWILDVAPGASSSGDRPGKS